MPDMRIFLTLSILLLQYTCAQIQISDKPRCYFPDGSLRNDTDYQPCNNAAGIDSMCCAIANGATDICLSNGLCSGATADGVGRALWRETCTDPTWKSPACVKICLSKGAQHDWLSHDAPVTLCEDGTVCCGGTVTGGNCCSSNLGVQLATGLPQPTATVTAVVTSVAKASSTSEKTTAASTTMTSSTRSTTVANLPLASSLTSSISSTSSTAATSSPSQSPMPVPSNTTKIALGIAVPVSLVAISVAGYMIWRHRSRHRKPQVYEKNTRGPVEISTSDTLYRARDYTRDYTRNGSTDKRPEPQELHAISKYSNLQHHVNLYEMQ